MWFIEVTTNLCENSQEWTWIPVLRDTWPEVARSCFHCIHYTFANSIVTWLFKRRQVSWPLYSALILQLQAATTSDSLQHILNASARVFSIWELDATVVTSELPTAVYRGSRFSFTLHKSSTRIERTRHVRVTQHLTSRTSQLAIKWNSISRPWLHSLTVDYRLAELRTKLASGHFVRPVTCLALIPAYCGLCGRSLLLSCGLKLNVLNYVTLTRRVRSVVFNLHFSVSY